jgi:hypothetical protein
MQVRQEFHGLKGAATELQQSIGAMFGELTDKICSNVHDVSSQMEAT